MAQTDDFRFETTKEKIARTITYPELREAPHMSAQDKAEVEHLRLARITDRLREEEAISAADGRFLLGALDKRNQALHAQGQALGAEIRALQNKLQPGIVKASRADLATVKAHFPAPGRGPK